jgi:L-lactate utilization protein LutC
MDYQTLPDVERLNKSMEAIRLRGIEVILAETKEAALAQIQAWIPMGASVMTGASITLQQIGFEVLLNAKEHPWKYLKAEIIAEEDANKRLLLRKKATQADYFVGSVHAIAETGEIVVASATGSQLAPYAYTSNHIIWVDGAQKITPSLADAFRRVREYSLVVEDRNMRQRTENKMGSFIGKILVFEREAPYLNRKVRLILVNEILGV